MVIITILFSRTVYVLTNTAAHGAPRRYLKQFKLDSHDPQKPITRPISSAIKDVVSSWPKWRPTLRGALGHWTSEQGRLIWLRVKWGSRYKLNTAQLCFESPILGYQYKVNMPASQIAVINSIQDLWESSRQGSGNPNEDRWETPPKDVWKLFKLGSLRIMVSCKHFWRKHMFGWHQGMELS